MNVYLSVLVTGASSGLGREIAIKFSQKGYFLLLSGRNAHELLKTQKRCGMLSEIIPGDLRETDTRNRIVHAVKSAVKSRDTRIFINCASVYSNTPLLSCENSDEIISTNLSASVNLIRSIYSVFTKREHCTIVNINSSAGKNPAESEPIYSASKHGLAGFFKSIRLEARQYDVRIMDVFIGGMRTPMMRHRLDWEYLIDPCEAAEIIVSNIANMSKTLQIDEITLSRFKFPPTA